MGVHQKEGGEPHIYEHGAGKQPCMHAHLARRAAAEEELKVPALGRDGAHLLLW